jgi:hypothetical protein
MTHESRLSSLFVVLLRCEVFVAVLRGSFHLKKSPLRAQRRTLPTGRTQEAPLAELHKLKDPLAGKDKTILCPHCSPRLEHLSELSSQTKPFGPRSAQSLTDRAAEHFFATETEFQQMLADWAGRNMIV